MTNETQNITLNIALNVTMTHASKLEVQADPKPKRGHRDPVENEELKAAIAQAQARQAVIKDQEKRIRLANKIEQLFGKATATRYMAGML